MTPRLHVPEAGDAWDADRQGLSLEQAEAHYLGQVLRLREGDPLEVFDGRGRRFAARLSRIGRRDAGLELLEEQPGNRLGALRLTLVQALSAAEKMDWTLEKATELGVARIIPVLSRRSKVRLEGERADRRQAHWQRLVVAASMQSQRDELPEVEPIQSLAAVLAREDLGQGITLVPPGPEAALPRLAQWAPDNSPDAAQRHISLLVGPESGLDAEEIDEARAAGWSGFTLGPRILRTETAGLAALAILQARFGDL